MSSLNAETLNTLALFVALVLVSIYHQLRVQKVEKRADERQGKADERSAENKKDIKVVSGELAETKDALSAAQSSIGQMQQNLQFKDDELKVLRTDLNEKNQENMAHGNAITRLLDENQGLHTDLEASKTRLAALEGIVTERNTAVGELAEERRQRQGMETKLTEANRRIDELERLTRDQQVKIAAFEMIFNRLSIVVTAPVLDTVSPPPASAPVSAEGATQI